MQRHYRTPKGTELPILNLRGKEYLEVKYRLVWMREEHPTWSINTVIIDRGPTYCLVKCTVNSEDGSVVATAHKFEDAKGFPDFIEKAETGAVGRALAMCGFGTQFASDELDEADRLVDSPVKAKENTPGFIQSITNAVIKPKPSPGLYVFPDGFRNLTGTRVSDHNEDTLKRALEYSLSKTEHFETAKAIRDFLSEVSEQ